MNRSDIECRDELDEIVGVGGDAEVPAVVGTWAGPEVALGVGNEPIALGDLLSHRLPYPKVGKSPMHEDDGFA
jgi:hypothetical protein